MLKIGAIGGIFALRFALMRRSRAQAESGDLEASEAAPQVRHDPHPVSRKKKRRRRR